MISILLTLGLLLALYRVASNRSYLSGRNDMRKRYAPDHGPDLYEVSLLWENKRLLCAALVFGTGLVAKLTIFS